MQIDMRRLKVIEKMNIEKVVALFKKIKIFDYIEMGYGIFHCEGDDAVLEDIDELLMRKGIDIYAEIG